MIAGNNLFHSDLYVERALIACILIDFALYYRTVHDSLPSANCHVWMFHRLLHFSLSNFTQGNYIYNSIIVINSEDDDDDDAPSLHWLRVRESILFKIAVMTFSALNGSAPVCLPSYFTRVTDVPSRQRLRSASSNQLRLTSPPSANRKASFRCHLLEHMTSAPSLAIFKQRLMTFLFHLTSPDLIFWFAPCFIVDLAIIFVI